MGCKYRKEGGRHCYCTLPEQNAETEVQQLREEPAEEEVMNCNNCGRPRGEHRLIKDYGMWLCPTATWFDDHCHGTGWRIPGVEKEPIRDKLQRHGLSGERTADAEIEDKLDAVVAEEPAEGEAIKLNDPMAPVNWCEHHHKNCGTKFRGCDPKLCAKDHYERTGVWKSTKRLEYESSHPAEEPAEDGECIIEHKDVTVTIEQDGYTWEGAIRMRRVR